MKQIFIFFLAITFAGLLSIGCDNKKTHNDRADTFDVATLKKIIDEKTIGLHKPI